MRSSRFAACGHVVLHKLELVLDLYELVIWCQRRSGVAGAQFKKQQSLHDDNTLFLLGIDSLDAE